MFSASRNAFAEAAQSIAKPANEDFENRLGNLMSRLGQSSDQQTGTAPVSAPEPSTGMGIAMAELSSLAKQLAQVDLMMTQVTDGDPQEEEAKRFQQISLRALQWSRDMLCQKQSRYLVQLGVTTGATVPQPDSQGSDSKWMGWSKAEVEACPEFVPSAQHEVVSGVSLRQDLEYLRECESGCVVIVRKIKKLGFDSPKYLEEYFSQYGDVSKVLVAHSHVKPTAKRPNGRVRPAALGFIVMAEEGGAQRALAAGHEHTVCDTLIELSSFDAFDEAEQEAWDKFQ